MLSIEKAKSVTANNRITLNKEKLVLEFMSNNPNQNEIDNALNAAMDYALSLGITQVHDMGSWKDLETYSRNHKKGNLKIHEQ